MKGRRAVVVLTDGRDQDYDGKAAGSVHTYDEIVNLMRKTEATAFPVATWWAGFGIAGALLSVVGAAILLERRRSASSLSEDS